MPACVTWTLVVRVCGWRSEAAWGVSLRETASSADLGVSSKYSSENFED